MTVFTALLQGIQMCMNLLRNVNYNGISGWTVAFYGFIGVCILRFILPLFIPKLGSHKSDKSDGVRNR